MRNLTLAPILLILLLIALASGDMTAQTSFNYRAVHLIEGTAAIDVHFNERETASIQGVPFETVSQQLRNLPAIDDAFSVQYTATATGVGAAIVSAEQTGVESNREFVGVGWGTTANPTLTMIERNRAQVPQPGKVLMNVMHASEVAIPIDVYVGVVGSTPQVAGVEQGMVSPYVSITDEPTTLFITAAGSKQPIATLSAPFGPSNPYVTLIVTGSSPQDLVVYVLNIGTPPQEVGSLIRLDAVSFTDIRVLNLRPGQGTEPGAQLDVYLAQTSRADIKVADTLSYRWASRTFGPLVADTFRIGFVAPGESPSSPVYSFTRQYRNDTAYVVALTQFADRRPVGLVLTRNPLEPIPPGLGSTLVRFANATEEFGSLRAEIVGGSTVVSTDPIPFLGSTDFEPLPPGEPMSVRIYRTGSPDPIYEEALSGIPAVPAGAYLTVFAFGTSAKLSVDLLNESLPGRRRLGTFDPGGPGSVLDRAESLVRLGFAPNPTTGAGSLSVSLDRPGTISSSLIDPTGRIVTSGDHGLRTDGDHTLSLDLPTLPQGTYRLLVTVDGRLEGSVPVVVVR